ncbi:MAG: glycosyltransferase family 2 protein [Actinomycetes bacterium]
MNEHLAGDMLLTTGSPGSSGEHHEAGNQDASATTAGSTAPMNPMNEVTSNRVTVVVPARNEEVAVGRCLDSILEQDWEDMEVLVVDGASTDGSRDVVAQRQQRDPRVRLLHNERQIIPVALNLALAEATGRWLVRVDAHATIPRDYVRRAVEHLSTGLYGGVGGRKDGAGVTTAGRAIAAAMGSRFGVGGSTYHRGTAPLTDVEHVPFGAYPVALLRELGGWDERLRVNQDFELDFRLRESGHRILFDPQMRIDWQSRQSVRELFWQYHRYGRGKVSVAWLHPSSLRPRHLAAPGLVLTLLGSALVAVRRPRLALALLAPYVAALTAASSVTARSVHADARPHVAPAFVAMHVGWGLGFWQGVWQLLASPNRRLERVRNRGSARTPGTRDR